LATITIARTIHAPTAVVFRTVADPAHFAEAISGVTRIEFLSSTKCGLGTRFRQSRVLNGQEMTLDFDVTDYIENQRVRIVNEIHGTRWDSVITLTPSSASTTLTMRMDTKTRPLVPRLLMPLMLRLFIKRSVEKDFDAVKAFCEKESAN
jgi:carbon monoxide dehydrogenase subunit G